MAIVYAGGTVVNQLFTGITTPTALLNAINSALVSAGWSSALAKPYTTAVFTGQPNNGDTITVDAQTYTFNTVLGGANSILIDSSAFQTYTNLKSALNGTAGAGTKYGTGTTVNATMEGGRISGGGASGYLLIQRKVGGFFTTPGCSESVANMTLTIGGSIQGGGYNWTSARTPQGLACVISGLDFGDVANPPLGVCIRMVGSNVEQTFVSNDYNNASPNNTFSGGRMSLANTSWRVIANRYWFTVKAEGIPPSTEGAWFTGGVIYLYPPLAPTPIASVANTTPIRITTSAPHGLITGDNACVRGSGVAAADINAAVTVISPTEFDLNGTTAGGTSSTGYAAKVAIGAAGAQVSEFIFCCMGDGTARFPGTNLTTNATFYWSLLNGSIGGGNGGAPGGTGVPALAVPVNSIVSGGQFPNKFYSGQALITEPFMMCGNTQAGTAFIIGQLYSAAIVCESLPLDLIGSFDSHNWICLTDSNTGSAGIAEASLLVEVP